MGSLLGCPAPPTPPAPTGPARADVTFRDVTVRHYRGGSLRMVATSPVMELTRGTNDFTAVDAGVFLQQTGGTIFARHVTGNSAAQVATGTGGVQFVGADGTEGATERATYDRALGSEGGAFSDAGVIIDHPRFHLTATSFTADLADQRVLFDAPVTRTKE